MRDKETQSEGWSTKLFKSMNERMFTTTIQLQIQHTTEETSFDRKRHTQESTYCCPGSNDLLYHLHISMSICSLKPEIWEKVVSRWSMCDITCINQQASTLRGDESTPRSTSRNGHPLAKIMFGPACWNASLAVHSAAKPTKKWKDQSQKIQSYCWFDIQVTQKQYHWK